MITMLNNKLILVIGAGDFASGCIRRLHLAGAKVVCTELEQPLTIRRQVAFSEAIYSGEHTVEGVTGVRVTRDYIPQIFSKDMIPILVDPDTKILQQDEFDIVIDARMAKKNLGTKISDAPIVIGLGPGFEAGKDCHAVVETLAGHNLGRVIYEGKPAQNTGTPIPTDLEFLPCAPCCSGFENTACSVGFDVNTLVLRAPSAGEFKAEREIGEIVNIGDLIGMIEDSEVKATALGVLRGLIHDGVLVSKGLKIGDIDPSGDVARVNQISEKANAIGGGVLEASLYLLNRKST